MSEYGILHDEARYRVDGFVDEVLWRTRNVITEMGFKFEALLRDMMRQFDAYQQRNYLVVLDGVHFAQTRWMTDGTVRIDFAIGSHADAGDFMRHEVIDAFVDTVVQRYVPRALRDEFSAFIRTMITQFAALKKHSSLLLSGFTFGDVEWASESQLAFTIRYHGEPFIPSMVRW